MTSPPSSRLREVQHYGICRDDIVLGRILGEGFFGEVYEGIYTTPVRLPLFLCPPSSQIWDPARIWDVPFPLFFLRAERRADQRGREDLQEGLQPGKPGKIPERSRYPDGPDGNFGIPRILLGIFGILSVLPGFFGILGFFPLWILGFFGILSVLLGFLRS